MFLIKKYEWKTDTNGFQFRTDATGQLIVPRALEIREGKVFERKTAPLGVEQLVPTKMDLPFGFKDETFEYSDSVAEAQIATGNNTDIPFADTYMVEETEKIIKIRKGYRYTQEEWDALLQASKFQAYGRNANISTQRQAAAVKGIRTKDHLIGMFGAAAHGVQGFYNSTEVDVYDETVFNPYNAASDGQALLDWYVDTLVGTIEDNTNLTEQPNIIVQPKRLTRKLVKTQIENGAGEGNGITAMDLIVEAMKQIGAPITIVSRNESRSDFLEEYGVQTPGTNKDRLVVYCRDIDCLNRRTSRIRVGEWEEYRGEYSRILDQNIRGVRWHYAKSALYVDIPDAPA